MKFPIILMILFFSTTASAEMYKWVDEHGTINFGTTPPQGEYNVEKRPLNTQIPTTTLNEDIKMPEIIFEDTQKVSENNYAANNQPASSSECTSATEEYKKQVEWNKYNSSKSRIKDHFASEHRKELSEAKRKMNEACGINKNTQRKELAQQPTKTRSSASIVDEPVNHGIHTTNGQFLAPSGPNYVGPDGTLYVPSGPNGIINTRTGQFSPTF